MYIPNDWSMVTDIPHLIRSYNYIWWMSCWVVLFANITGKPRSCVNFHIWDCDGYQSQPFGCDLQDLQMGFRPISTCQNAEHPSAVCFSDVFSAMGNAGKFQHLIWWFHDAPESIEVFFRGQGLEQVAQAPKPRVAHHEAPKHWLKSWRGWLGTLPKWSFRAGKIIYKWREYDCDNVRYDIISLWLIDTI